jgi:ribosomal protein S18 acetylase RimI-like enzyme
MANENNALFIDINVMYENEIAKKLYKSFNFKEFKVSLRNKLD